MATLDTILAKLDKLDKLDGLFITIDNLLDSYKDLVNNQQQLEKKVNFLIAENTQLKNQVNKVNCELDRINQQALNTNIEIAGVPTKDFEDPKVIASRLIEHLGIKDNNIIKSAYRKRGKPSTAGLPQPIIVTIIDKGQRDKILVARRNRDINSDTILPNSTSEVNTLGCNRTVYINEHLTDRNKYLLARAKELKRCNKVSSAFTRNGFVIIKIDSDPSEIRITTIRQLDEFNTKRGKGDCHQSTNNNRCNTTEYPI